MHRPRIRSALAFLISAGALATASVAMAQGGGIYQQERAACDGIQQDRAACIREAGAARQEARRGGLTSAPSYEQNALARCQLHPPAERSACEARVLGAGQTTIQGSVMGGGLIRETVTPLPPVAPLAPMPAPLPAPAPVPVMPPR